LRWLPFTTPCRCLYALRFYYAVTTLPALVRYPVTCFPLGFVHAFWIHFSHLVLPDTCCRSRVCRVVAYRVYVCWLLLPPFRWTRRITLFRCTTTVYHLRYYRCYLPAVFLPPTRSRCVLDLWFGLPLAAVYTDATFAFLRPRVRCTYDVLADLLLPPPPDAAVLPRLFIAYRYRALCYTFVWTVTRQYRTTPPPRGCSTVTLVCWFALPFAVLVVPYRLLTFTCG